MEHFVTLYDSLFLPQGLALHASMERHVKSYVLWVLCVDDEVFKVLHKLQLPNIRLLPLSNLETEELLHIKPTRTKGEYCWTLTPFSPKFVFDADVSVERVTYLDADLWFRKSPQPIFDEFEASGKQVLITDHGFDPEIDQSAISGQYCVQFATFTRHGGEPVRKWWAEQCIKWCFNRFEDGKFGDQKYLESFIHLFDCIHVAQKKEWFLAPWNALMYPYSSCIIYHFHSYRVGKYVKFTNGEYLLPKPLLENVYKIYTIDVLNAIKKMASVGYHFKLQFTRQILRDRIISLIVFVKRLLWFSQYHYSHPIMLRESSKKR